MDAISVLQQSKTPAFIVRRIKWNEAENSYITVENYRHNKRTVCNIPAPQFLDGWFHFGHGYASSTPYTITLDINEDLPAHYHEDYFEKHPYFDLWIELSGGNLVITYDSAWYASTGWKDDGCAGSFLIYMDKFTQSVRLVPHRSISYDCSGEGGTKSHPLLFFSWIRSC